MRDMGLQHADAVNFVRKGRGTLKLPNQRLLMLQFV
jgi:hypothetical protein